MKEQQDVYAFPNAPAPYRPVVFDPDVCNGCNECLACQLDVLLPNPEKGRPPIIMYPDECWSCGSCEALCPRPGAIRIQNAIMQKSLWRDKKTGELFLLE